jgi:hypothetical protein
VQPERGARRFFRSRIRGGASPQLFQVRLPPRGAVARLGHRRLSRCPTIEVGPLRFRFNRLGHHKYQPRPGACQLSHPDGACTYLDRQAGQARPERRRAVPSVRFVPLSCPPFEPALGKQILHVPVAQREAQVEPDRLLDDRSRDPYARNARSPRSKLPKSREVSGNLASRNAASRVHHRGQQARP